MSHTPFLSDTQRKCQLNTDSKFRKNLGFCFCLGIKHTFVNVDILFFPTRFFASPCYEERYKLGSLFWSLSFYELIISAQPLEATSIFWYWTKYSTIGFDRNNVSCRCWSAENQTHLLWIYCIYGSVWHCWPGVSSAFSWRISLLYMF